MQLDLHTEIETYLSYLKLPEFKKNYRSLAEASAKDNNSYEEYFLRLLELEYQRRVLNRKKQIIKLAGFPEKKYLEDIKRDDLPAAAKKAIPQLERLDFIANGQNIVLAGNPGTGKTHLAIGLGIKACNESKRVFFTTVPRLLTQIRECKSNKTLRQLELKFENYDLVICDEFGYVNFDKEGAELLFNHLSLRAGRKSTIITTNLAFDKWADIFGDPIITAALVDRLAHKSFMINMNGPSYRVKETQKLLNI